MGYVTVSFTVMNCFLLDIYFFGSFPANISVMVAGLSLLFKEVSFHLFQRPVVCYMQLFSKRNVALSQDRNFSVWEAV